MKIDCAKENMYEYEDVDEENNNDYESEPGFFNEVVRPMLYPAGRDRDLIEWLKQIGLIAQMQKCKNWENNERCSVPMTWTPAKIPDCYQWKCLGCSHKRSIRDSTIFQNLKCKFSDAIKVLLGWCKGKDQETVTRMLDLRKQVVKSIYTSASKVAEKYITSNMSDFMLGGPGIIVVIDTYPDPLSSLGYQPYKKHISRPVLCIAEVKSIPTNFWVEALERYDPSNFAEIDYVNDRALRIVQQVVRPGSIIVSNGNTNICCYNDLQTLRHLYSVIVSNEDLTKHDSQLQSLVRNLQLIWRPILGICEQAQCCSLGEVQHFLFRYIWRQRYGTQSFQMLLTQLAYLYSR